MADMAMWAGLVLKPSLKVGLTRGLGFRVQGLGFRVEGLEFRPRVWGLGACRFLTRLSSLPKRKSANN